MCGGGAGEMNLLSSLSRTIPFEINDLEIFAIYDLWCSNGGWVGEEVYYRRILGVHALHMPTPSFPIICIGHEWKVFEDKEWRSEKTNVRKESRESVRKREREREKVKRETGRPGVLNIDRFAVLVCPCAACSVYFLRTARRAIAISFRGEKKFWIRIFSHKWAIGAVRALQSRCSFFRRSVKFFWNFFVEFFFFAKFSRPQYPPIRPVVVVALSSRYFANFIFRKFCRKIRYRIGKNKNFLPAAAPVHHVLAFVIFPSRAGFYGIILRRARDFSA